MSPNAVLVALLVVAAVQTVFPVAHAACLTFWSIRMPRDQAQALGREILRRERTPLGRVMKAAEYILLALIALAVWRWLLGL
ncbi:MAG: hypothetical protein AABZ20_05720 [candidate division NC10 bacterium]